MPESIISPNAPPSGNDFVPPEEIRYDVSRLGQYINNAYLDAARSRRANEIDWQRSLNLLTGYHYFQINTNTGQVMPLFADKDEVRAYTNLLYNRYRRALGARCSVATQVTALGRRLDGPGALHSAKRAKLAIADWREEDGFDKKFITFNEYMLVFGLAAMLVEPRWDSASATMHVIPGCDLFPIPGNATTDENTEGCIYRKFISEAYIERAIAEGRLMPDVRGVGRGSAGMTSSFSSQGSFSTLGDNKGAWASFFYFRPSAEFPSGAHGMAIGSQIYALNIDRQRGVPSLPAGGMPTIVKDVTVPGSWYPQAFCDALIALNLQDDEELSNEIAISRLTSRGGWTYVPEKMVSADNMIAKFGGIIPYKTDDFGVDMPNKPIVNVAPPSIPRDSMIIGSRVVQEADATASQYPIARGVLPDRTADVTLQRAIGQTELPDVPVYTRTRLALLTMFGNALDVLGITWPQEKWLSVVGPMNVPQETLLRKQDFPRRGDIKLEMAPLVPGDRSTTLGFLNGLRNAKEITSEEYKAALKLNGFEPPGLNFDNPKRDFAVRKALFIYNDGIQPREWPDTSEDFLLEPHKECVVAFKEFMATFEYRILTSPEVRHAMYQTVLRHNTQLANPLQWFDADTQIQDIDTQRMDNQMTADREVANVTNGQLSEMF